MNIKVVFNANNFNRSIISALRNPPDAKASAARIKRIINGLPKGTLYCSNHANYVDFYVIEKKRQKYLSKKSKELPSLARKKYLCLLLEILELTASTRTKDIERRKRLIEKLQKLIRIYEKANLDIAKIVLTSAQYKWYTGRYVQKFIGRAKDKELVTASGITTRSKSEREIINKYEEYAIPLHYEEQKVIYVRPLVDKLEKSLRSSGLLHPDGLYSYMNGNIHWNVPPELSLMNTRGSIWMSFYPPKGTVTIYVDITIMFADGMLFLQEHEGLMDSFLYRHNAMERTGIMKYANAVSGNSMPERRDNFIETYEHDVDMPEKVIDIIERCILPRLWF